MSVLVEFHELGSRARTAGSSSVTPRLGCRPGTRRARRKGSGNLPTPRPGVVHACYAVVGPRGSRAGRRHPCDAGRRCGAGPARHPAERRGQRRRRERRRAVGRTG